MVIPMPSRTDTILEKGLPANIDAERFVLGAVMLNESLFMRAASLLTTDDFSLTKHQRIWRRITDLQEHAERIDRVTVAEELMKHDELVSCDGLGYLLSLEDGIPHTDNIDAYVRIVREKAQLRRLIYAAQGTVERAMEAEERSTVIAGRAAEQFLQLGSSDAKGSLQSFGTFIETHPGGVNTLLDPASRRNGLLTGYTKFDNKTGGFRPGELIVIAARPAMGKTALALNIAQHVAISMHPKPVAVFSLEMSQESLWTRLLCTIARVNQAKFRAGFLNAKERSELMRASSQLGQAPLYLDDTANLAMPDLYSKCRKAKAEHGLALVIVDYMQLMSSRGRPENRVQEVSAIPIVRPRFLALRQTSATSLSERFCSAAAPQSFSASTVTPTPRRPAV